MEEKDILMQKLKMANRALAILEERAAAYTSATIPVDLQISLEDKRAEVADTKAQLAALDAPAVARTASGPGATGGRRKSLETAIETLEEKLILLRQQWAIQAGTSVKFQLEKEIEQTEAELDDLHARLDALD